MLYGDVEQPAPEETRVALDRLNLESFSGLESILVVHLRGEPADRRMEPPGAIEKEPTLGRNRLALA
jgi:hypothetical protein